MMYQTALKSSIQLAKGCTEPVAVALAAAKCGAQLDQAEPATIEVAVSANIFKNALAVIVPGTGEAGLPVAASLGYLWGDPAAGLGVIPQLTTDQRTRVLGLVHSGKVTVTVADVPAKLYVAVKVTTLAGHTALTKIAGSHTNIYFVQQDDQVVLDNGKPTQAALADWLTFMRQTTLADIWDFAVNQEAVEGLQFIMPGWVAVSSWRRLILAPATRGLLPRCRSASRQKSGGRPRKNLCVRWLCPTLLPSMFTPSSQA